MSSARDVVITGVGIVSPIGIGRDAFLQALQNGESGVRPITQYDPSEREVRIGGELVDFEPKLYVKPRKSLKVMSREIQLGVASAQLAVEDASLDTQQVDTDRFGVVFGSPMLYGEVHELRDLYAQCVKKGKFDFTRFGDQFPSQMFPLWLLKYLPNMTASHIGIAHGARGPNNTVVLGDVSSLLAIIEAATVIERGRADVMLTGGSGSRLALTDVTYRYEENLSKRNDDPASASRPFDAERDGMVNGEGGGSLVLESREHAESRGAEIIGTIVGYSRTHRGTGSQQKAVENSIRSCLRSASLSFDQVSHVNAHGLSTIDNDVAEATAIRQVLGDVPVTATKSYFGNLGASSGAIEIAASLLTASQGSIPATLNYRNPDPHCPIKVVTNCTTFGRGTFIKLNQSATGQSAAIAITV